jgi:YVTN family beta-propeller protein
MKQNKLKYLFIASAFTAILASCHKDKIVGNSGTPTAQRAGIYILNQGGLGDNNSSLTYYDYTSKQLYPDLFATANPGVPLGDVANDIGIYGSKMYIVVNNSNVVDIVNPKTAKLIKQDSLLTNHIGRLPRSIAFYKSNAFITCYDGTVAVMDTASLAITQSITVGRNPEQLVVANNKLYVANSGGYSGNFDNTVSVIDLSTLTVTKTITVITNPVGMATDSYGNVYVLSVGDYSTGSTGVPGIDIISSATDAVVSSPPVNLGFNVAITVQGDNVYYVTGDNKVAVYNAKTQTASQANFITDGTTITTPYALTADPISGEVFVADATDYASDGVMYAFDKTGKKEYSIKTGIIPGKMVLINK